MNSSIYIAFGIATAISFYQKLHIKNFQGASQMFGAILTIFAGVVTITFLVILGLVIYKHSFLEAIYLIGTGLGAILAAFFIESILKIPGFTFFVSFLGFAAIPASFVFIFMHI